MVYGKGNNDKPRGWTALNNENAKIYKLWINMLKRCYSEKYQADKPTYKGCKVCESWLTLSNFEKDIKLLPNYNKWLNQVTKDTYEFDKDILCESLGLEEKIYSPTTCQFITKVENIQHMNKTMERKPLSKEHKEKIAKNNPRLKKVKCVNLQTNEVLEFDYVTEAARQMEQKTNLTFKSSSVHLICKYNHDPEEYMKKHRCAAKTINKIYTFYYSEDYDKN